MNQENIGKFIAALRKEKKLSQRRMCGSRKSCASFSANRVSGGEGLDKEVTVNDEVICYENLRYIPRGI